MTRSMCELAAVSPLLHLLMAYGISVRERHHHEDALYKIELDVYALILITIALGPVVFSIHLCIYLSSFGFDDDYRGVPTTTSNISDEGLCAVRKRT